MTDIDALCLVHSQDHALFLRRCFGPIDGVAIRYIEAPSSGIRCKRIVVDDYLYVHPRAKLNMRYLNEVWVLRLGPGCEGNIQRQDVYRYLEARKAEALQQSRKD